MISSVVLAGCLAIAPSAPDIYAIVVGYNGAAEGLPQLQYADDDALRFALFFQGLAQKEHVWLLTEWDEDTLQALKEAGITPPPAREPTRTQLFTALAELRQELRQRDRRNEAAVYFLYAGHGLGSRFLVKPERGTEMVAVTGHELRAAIADLEADRATLLFDSCRSQALFVERGGSELGPDLSQQIEALEQRANSVKIGVLTAATSVHPAAETTELRGGYFSHVLASGLAGAADADGDDVVTFGELAAFVAFNTERLTGTRPWFEPPGGDLHAPAIDHRGRSTRLVMGAPESGRFLVESSAGNRIFAEVNKGSGKPLKLALPPGRYRVVHMLDDVHGHAGDVELVAGVSSEVTAASLLNAVEMDWGSTRERGSASRYEPLKSGFPAPFTSEVVSALAAGYHSGKEPSRLVATWKHSFALGYGVSQAPLNWPSLEQGVGIGYRYFPGRFFVGVDGDFRTSSNRDEQGQFNLQRAGWLIDAGARFSPLKSFTFVPWLGVGMWSLWRQEQGRTVRADPTIPRVDVGTRAEYELGSGFAAFLDLRFEVSWVRLSEKRETFAQPLASLGLEYRL